MGVQTVQRHDGGCQRRADGGRRQLNLCRCRSKGDESYTYGPEGDLTVEYFYAEQRGGKFASVGRSTRWSIGSAFEKVLMAGGRSVSMLRPACPARCNPRTSVRGGCGEDYPERKVVVVDTLCASVGEAMLRAREAARMQQEGEHRRAGGMGRGKPVENLPLVHGGYL